MKYIILFLALISSFSLQAAPTCSINGTRVIYTNGVITSQDDAQLAMRRIKGLGLNSQIDFKKVGDYRLAYNFSESPAQDFLEAAVQRFPAIYLKSQGVSNGYAAFMGFLNGGLANAIYDVALNSIVNQYLEIQSNWIRDNYNQPKYIETLQKIKGLYEIALNNGERVFAISHSQGGLFMRDAFDQIIFANKKKVFSGFQIASPLGSEMSGHFGYATHDKDRLINFIRGRAGALNANVVAPAYIVNDDTGSIRDDFIEYYINHGILTTYLYDTPVQFNEPTIRSQVISELIKTAQLLESNCPKAVINYTKNNLQVNFDSTDPEDPNMTGLTYSWNFGDGQTANTTSKALSHTYTQAGTYNVSLTVTDSFGTSDTASATVIVQGCTNCDTPQVKIFASGATETSPGIFKTPSAGQSARVSIDVVDLNNDTGTTIFTITYNEYRYDINTYPFNIFTNTIVNGSSASIPIPFASTTYFIGITAYNPITKKTGYATASFTAINDSMPSISIGHECYQSTDSEGNLVNNGGGSLLIGAKDPDSAVIFLGTWYPNQSTGNYEGDFTNYAENSPNGYFYSFKNYEFNEREGVYGVYVFGRNEMRVIYQNSDGQVGFVSVTNPCEI